MMDLTRRQEAENLLRRIRASGIRISIASDGTISLAGKTTPALLAEVEQYELEIIRLFREGWTPET